ncbi:hypothetical protein [Desulfurobacterium crinifex]
MAEIKITVKIKKKNIPAIYHLKPSEAFSLFREKLLEIVEQLPSDRVTNRAIKEIFRKQGRKRLSFLEKKFKKLDSSSIMKKKVIYSSFYRVFQRLRWAEESGSEREVELRVWATSSIDYLYEVVRLLEERE